MDTLERGCGCDACRVYWASKRGVEADRRIERLKAGLPPDPPTATRAARPVTAAPSA